MSEALVAALERLDGLVQEFEELPYPRIREQIFEMLQLIDLIHRQPLDRWVTRLREEGREGWVDEAAADPMIRTLFLLYDLIPADELDAMDRATAFVPLGTLDAPDAPEAPAPAESFIPLERVFTPTPTRRYYPVGTLDELPPEGLRRIEVAGVGLLVVRLDGRVVAVRNQCPGSMAPLELGSYNAPIVICPWHNEPFDLRTGRRADGEREPTLTLLPVRVRDGVIEVELEPPSTGQAP